MNITIHHSSSSGNLYQVDNLLLEAGVPIREIKRCLGFRLSGVAGCLVSHEHGDHARGAADLMRAGVDVWCSEGTAHSLGLRGHRLHIVKALGLFYMGGWWILPFEVQHDTAEPLGFLLAKGNEKLLFATDTAYIRYRFQGLTHVMLGCDFDSGILERNILAGSLAPEVAKRTLHNHMSLKTALDFFRANDMSRVEAIHLLHLSDGNSDEAAFKREVERVTGRPVYIASK
jgi:phosphoribosyl 1,2-cyclic phosphodiesterase